MLDILPQVPPRAIEPEHLDRQEIARRAAWPVALVSMPFISMTRPSIQIGLLKALATSSEFPATTFHLNLDFAAQIGTSLYEKLCQHRGRMFGDWLFSKAAFGDAAPDQEDALFQVFETDVNALLKDVDDRPERLTALRNAEIPEYLDGLVDSINWNEFKVVGFTSTFQQSVASFALASRIKQRWPEVITVFGGANFEGEMGLELVRGIHCIDFAVIGEGDRAWPALLVELAHGRDPAAVPNVVRREGSGVTMLDASPSFRAMDTLPTPDYSEYFTRAERLGLLRPGGRRNVYLPFESARGCRWGEKNQCTFCGLNGADITFRSKSPSRLARELAELARNYRSFQFEAVDNIVNFTYLKQFFPLLVDAETDYEFFYEVKSNLTREKIRILASGGVRNMQPGIESLNSHILQLMSKGVTAIQNVNTLRWGQHYGIRVNWNLIWGFPGETTADVAAQLEVLPNVVHLNPPSGAGRIWMERYSPIFHDRERFPAQYIRPEASYSFVYPTSLQLDKVAYFFDYQLDDTLPDSVYKSTTDIVHQWQDAWKNEPRPTLTFWSSPGFLQIEDSRVPDRPGTYTFHDALALLYRAVSNQPLTAAEVVKRLDISLSSADVERALEEYCKRGLMFRDGNQFLSLALPATKAR